jgi:hypothetical protein
MKFYFVMLMLCISLMSCEKEALERECGTDVSEEEITWLQTIIAEHTPSANQLSAEPKAEIYRYTYHNQTYFLVNLCVGCPDATYVVYNCKGEVFCQGGGITGGTTCGDFNDNATDERLVWKD